MTKPPCPPLATKVAPMPALVDRLETQLAASHHATAEKLMEALVAGLTAQE